MLAVRALHVLAMALVFGGATLTWWLFRHADPTSDADADSGDAADSGTESDTDSAASPATETAVSVAAAYERGFWAALGVLVMTGVGNLGSLAPYVPAVGTQWGTVFAVKLALVVAVLALSVVRTLLVVRSRRVLCGETAATGSTTDTAAPDSAATATTGSPTTAGTDSTATAASNIDVRMLRLGYGATALTLALLVALAEVLAHG